MLNNKHYQDAKLVCFYYPKPEEVDTVELIKKELDSKNKVLVFPKVNGKNLDIFIIISLNDLEKGSYGIMEPKESCREINKEKIDLFVIPGLAFDKEGWRLGRGEGFYDKLLQRVPGYKLGLAYKFQIFKHMPHASHDVKLNELITP